MTTLFTVGSTAVPVDYRFIGGWHIYTNGDGLYAASRDAVAAYAMVIPSLERLAALNQDHAQ